MRAGIGALHADIDIGIDATRDGDAGRGQDFGQAVQVQTGFANRLVGLPGDGIGVGAGSVGIKAIVEVKAVEQPGRIVGRVINDLQQAGGVVTHGQGGVEGKPSFQGDSQDAFDAYGQTWRQFEVLPPGGVGEHRLGLTEQHADDDGLRVVQEREFETTVVVEPYVIAQILHRVLDGLQGGDVENVVNGTSERAAVEAELSGLCGVAGDLDRAKGDDRAAGASAEIDGV